MGFISEIFCSGFFDLILWMVAALWTTSANKMRESGVKTGFSHAIPTLFIVLAILTLCTMCNFESPGTAYSSEWKFSILPLFIIGFLVAMAGFIRSHIEFGWSASKRPLIYAILISLLTFLVYARH